MSGLKNSGKNNMKLVKESLDDNKNGLSESGGLRIGGSTYEAIRTPDGTVYAGKEGILGYGDHLLPWDLVKKILKKYSSDN
jgi:hypothetical protein